MLRSTRSRSKNTAAPALWAARVELLICGWRIIRAVKQFLEADADLLAVRHWNAGLAREAVSRPNLLQMLSI